MASSKPNQSAIRTETDPIRTPTDSIGSKPEDSLVCAAMASAIDERGPLYSCDHFVEPNYLLGNINDTPMIELVASKQQQAFGLAKRDTLPQYCLDCEVRFACHGGCPKDRFIRTPNGDEGLNYLCAGYKAFFKHIDPAMREMSRLLRQNRAPHGDNEFLRCGEFGLTQRALTQHAPGNEDNRRIFGLAQPSCELS